MLAKQNRVNSETSIADLGSVRIPSCRLSVMQITEMTREKYGQNPRFTPKLWVERGQEESEETGMGSGCFEVR